jgi:hypothetical protein
MEDAYVRSVQDVLQQFNVVQQSGLSDTAVQKSREEHGRNGKYTKVVLVEAARLSGLRAQRLTLLLSQLSPKIHQRRYGNSS